MAVFGSVTGTLAARTGSPLAASARLHGTATLGVENADRTARRAVVPYRRAIRLGTFGRDVVAVKHALWRVGAMAHPGKGKPFTPLWGPLAQRQLRQWQMRWIKGGGDGSYGRRTHVAFLSRGMFDAYSAWLMAHAKIRTSGGRKRAQNEGHPGRSRRVDVPSRPTPVGLRWRAPYHVDSTEERPNEWREANPRPVQPEKPPTQEAPDEPASDSSKQGYENVLLREINAIRAQNGLQALRFSQPLNEAAEFHSKAMATRGFFAHESADGSSFWKRVERFYASRGFRYWSAGENLAYGSPSLSPGSAVRAWMDSPGHRANLLSTAWQEIGLAAVQPTAAPGVYGGHPATIVTADFGVRR